MLGIVGSREYVAGLKLNGNVRANSCKVCGWRYSELRESGDGWPNGQGMLTVHRRDNYSILT